MGNMQAALTALAAFREAVALAPNHAEPWGALAIAYAYQFVRGSPSEAAANERQAKASMARALAIDPDNGDALQAGLAIDFAKGLPLAEVERRLDTALRRASDKSGLTDMRCFFFSQVGRDRAALSAFDQRMRIALPMSAPNEAARGYLLWGVGRTVEADQLLTRLMEQWPRHISVWFTLQKMLTYSGRYDRALALIDDVERRPLGVPEWNFELSRQQTLGLADPAAHRERALAMNRESARRGSGFAVNAMIYFSAVGRVDEAFEVADALYFGKGFIVPNQRFTAEQGSFDSRRRLTGYLFEPATATMRADPRFTGMTERLRLGAYWRESGSRPDYLA